MTRARPFTRLELTSRFEKSFRRLRSESKEQCAAALEKLLEFPATPGLHLKPILPGKKFWEARINHSERLILLPAGGMAYVIDVVSHDDLGRWSE